MVDDSTKIAMLEYVASMKRSRSIVLVTRKDLHGDKTSKLNTDPD